jgi:hypothetical protein
VNDPSNVAVANFVQKVKQGMSYTAQHATPLNASSGSSSSCPNSDSNQARSGHDVRGHDDSLARERDKVRTVIEYQNHEPVSVLHAYVERIRTNVNRGGIPYEATCDIYSFGVVLAELWIGKLQNYKKNSDSFFNFEKLDVLAKKDKRRGMTLGVDVAMDCDSPLPDFMVQYVELTLHCLEQSIEDRPSGEEAFDCLGKILETCLTACAPLSPSGAFVRPAGMSNGTHVCPTCRTWPILPLYEGCLVCVLRDDNQKSFDEILSARLTPVASEIAILHEKASATIPVLAHLDILLNNQVPRLFLLVPADLKNGWMHPRSWLRRKNQTTYHLFFICAETHQPVSPSLMFSVAKDWVNKIAPVLFASLYVLQVSLKAGLIPLDLGDIVQT